ncbi:UDP-N-acetylmuramoyl-L-alanyl-D-glutamate--2,6-diaminopimelate ligase [Sphingobacteriales bacterium UPWRP_1]|nr:UDP-N-acetylmuramoyl-L-alanyl-D-glutamate--2,6-diaminopimelate ligase [Sphingobacteriales bacterium TSM_CSM]PSJ78193.1 UDP-N-acetylmuramoyl-L-alanyl-D-glutamate--2,6-diaminopimelate ligase [Sphingobacteriales bacterium UPWRP_1]
MALLRDILYKVSLLEVNGTTDLPVAKICSDSRQVIPGSLFAAVSGTQTNGHLFVDKAIVNGATAILCEEMPPTLQNGVTYIKVENAARQLGIVASNFYGNPSGRLKLVGVTGTNGKTTTATLLFKLFRKLGYSVGLISTIRYYINDRQAEEATHTTPDAIKLNQLLQEMVNAGCTHCFMEVSSHAMAQHRVSGITFTGGIFTNITHDHLDFHGTFENYLKAKKSFFDMLPAGAFALTNADDRNGKVMLQNTAAITRSYALKTPADFKAKILENSFSGLTLLVDGQEVHTLLIGEFNAYNLMAVYGAACLLDEDKQEILTHLSALTAADGRFDYVSDRERNITGIVDYAHTPDALLKVLTTINHLRTKNEQLITVVGCGGNRDRTKRPLMAKLACELSDKVILTSDNPRNEDPDAIIAEMKTGIPPQLAGKTIAITNRREAIKTACMLANKNDIILVAGKGHETYQEINGIKHHFDDKEELINALKPPVAP